MCDGLMCDEDCKKEDYIRLSMDPTSRIQLLIGLKLWNWHCDTVSGSSSSSIWYRVNSHLNPWQFPLSSAFFKKEITPVFNILGQGQTGRQKGPWKGPCLPPPIEKETEGAVFSQLQASLLCSFWEGQHIWLLRGQGCWFVATATPSPWPWWRLAALVAISVLVQGCPMVNAALVGGGSLGHWLTGTFLSGLHSQSAPVSPEGSELDFCCLIYWWKSCEKWCDTIVWENYTTNTRLWTSACSVFANKTHIINLI